MGQRGRGSQAAAVLGSATLAARLVIVPGLGGSGPDHWQTIWEQAHPRARRFEPTSLDLPELEDWVEAIDRAVAADAEPPILVAHSLGTIAVSAWAARHASRARAVMLVAPPDASRPDAPAVIRPFAAVQPRALPIPSVVIASADDRYASLDHARLAAQGWEAPLIVAGARGHLNAQSGLGAWSDGAAALESLARASAA